MSQSDIYILSQPIQTGKTTLLQSWLKEQTHVAGFLTPDVDGLRMLYDIQRQTYHPLQVLTPDINTTSIGRFNFSNAGFNKAQSILNEASNYQGWVIVDEVGRLEINQKKGLEPALSALIEQVKSTQNTPALLLVIRDYLLEEAIAHYGLSEANVIPAFYFTPDFFKAKQNLHGIVLCGGQSVRMGRDKALLEYHHQPQFRYVQKQLLLCCNTVSFSCNEGNIASVRQYGKVFIDSATFSGRGPLSGVLTAFEHHHKQPLLVLGCDYPYLTINDILTLVMARDEQTDVVCYHNTSTGFDEPLLAIYESSTAPLLEDFFRQGGQSLRHFLTTVRVKRLHTNTRNLQSVDF